MHEHSTPWLTPSGDLRPGYRLYRFSFGEHDFFDQPEDMEDWRAFMALVGKRQWEQQDAQDEELLASYEPYSQPARLQQDFLEMVQDELDPDGEDPEGWETVVQGVFEKLDELLAQEKRQLVAASFFTFEGNHNDTELWVCLGQG